MDRFFDDLTELHGAIFDDLTELPPGLVLAGE